MALTDTFVKTVKPTGASAGDKHTDGQAMYLLVRPSGKYWRMDYRFDGRRKTLALGVYPEVSLAKARKRREAARELLADNIDPGNAKRVEKQARAEAGFNTFEFISRKWLATTASKRSAGTQEKVTSWLEKDVIPYIGSMPISSITPRDVLVKVARRMEARGVYESAHRIVQICGQVFRFASAEGVAQRDVTADLRGALMPIVKTNFAAITEPASVADLLRAIDGYSGHPCTVAALKLAPLVFVRPGELRAAEWGEIDLDTLEWRIPGTKMKMKNDHVVPLSKQAKEVLLGLHPLTGHGRYVFPSIRTGERPMSENTVNAALRAMGYGPATMTGHGFRAMARTIMDEVLGERVDLLEHQLAHAVKDANGRAYNRTAHLPDRRAMMQRWADYLDSLRRGGVVIPLRSAA